MPSGAFTLVFQCDSLPGKSAQVFRILTQDAAWQTAFQRWFPESELARYAGEWHVMKLTVTYVSIGFPDAVRMLYNGTSPIKCDFDLDDSCHVDVDRLVETAHDWELDDWDYNRGQQYSPKTFETEDPLPAWLDLRREDLIDSADEYEGS
jgi:hypothetical protein